MIAPVLFAATLLHAKPSHLEAKSSPEVGSGSGRQARCSLGVVVKAAPKRRSRRSGHSMQHSCENYPAVTVENTYLYPGFHAGAPDTQEGQQRKKTPTTPRAAMVAEAPGPGGKPAPSGRVFWGRKWNSYCGGQAGGG